MFKCYSIIRDARGTANTLKENYGFAGPKFISMIRGEGVIGALKALQKKFYTDLMKEDVQDKQVLSASILLAADELVTAGIFKDKKALTVNDIKQYLVSRSETDVNLRCYQWLIGFCAANPRRFDSADQSNGEVWGQYKDGYVCINKSVFEELLKNKGFSAGAFVDWARRKEILKGQFYGKGNKNNRPTRAVVVNGKQIQHYWVKLPDEELTESEEYQKYAAVDDPDMPF